MVVLAGHHWKKINEISACTTSQYTATLDGLGAVGDGAHADHEFLYIDKTMERVALLAMLIMAPQIKEDYYDFR